MTCGGIGSTAPRINIGARWTSVVNFTRRPLYPRYPLDKRRGEPQSQSNRVGEEKKPFPCTYRESNPGRPAHSLVSTLTEVTQINKSVYFFTNVMPGTEAALYQDPRQATDKRQDMTMQRNWHHHMSLRDT
jgi:hypothetical protein